MQPEEAHMERHRHAWLVVLVTLILLLAFSGGEATRAAQPTAIAKETKRIAVPGRGNVAAVGGAVWATDDAGRIWRINASTNRVVARIPLATRAPQFCCTFGFGALWLADQAAETLLRVDTGKNAVVARIPVGRSPVGTAVGFGSVWVANNGGASVMRIDPVTNKVVATIPVGRAGTGRPYGNGPLALAVGGGSVWATVPNSGTIVRIDPRANRVTASLAVRNRCALTARGGSVWAAGACADTRISRIDAKAGRVAATRDIGEPPGPPAVLGRYLWTVTFEGRLARLDAQTLKPAGSMSLPRLNVEGESLATGHGALWVRAEGFVVRLAPR
jgi:virginiamycin B lyase